MRLTILQTDITWADAAVNISHLDALTSALHLTDLIVLPEMFATGFAVKQPETDALSGGMALQWMRRKAAELHCAVAGSVAVKSEEGWRNRFYFIAPGIETFYDKRHLFTPGGEQEHFTPGQSRTVVAYRGVRICLFVCYDLRFPVWVRNRGDYDLALFVANWPEDRADAWDILLRARAIENQCYVAGINRVGSDPSHNYCGSSAVIDPCGNIVASCRRGVECSDVADIDLKKLASLRKTFPVATDADAFDLVK